MTDTTYIWNLKYDTNECIYKTKKYFSITMPLL